METLLLAVAVGYLVLFAAVGVVLCEASDYRQRLDAQIKINRELLKKLARVEADERSPIVPFQRRLS